MLVRAWPLIVSVLSVLIVSIQFPLTAAAQTFRVAPTYPTTFHPNMVAVGDVNGDGAIDLAVPSYSTQDVSILLGDGAGGFGPVTQYPAGAGPRFATLADFTGDTVLDIAVANQNSNDVSILIGNGTGSFSVPITLPVGATPYHIAIADLNDDGQHDLVVANSGSDTVSVLLGTGAGGFGSSTQFAAGREPRSTAVGDFNADGKLDLAVANYASASISVLLGTGTGAFSSPTSVTVGNGPHWLASADFNGDSRPDIAVPNFISGTVSVLLGDGAAGFVTSGTITVGKSPRSIAIADYNGDGRRDLAVANRDGSSISILLGDGSGTFAGGVQYGVSSGPFAVTAADVNADGVEDLVTANRDSMTVSVLLGEGNGAFPAPIPTPVGTNPRGVAAGDFDGDGKLDIVAVNNKSNNVSVLLGDGAGGVRAASSFATALSPYTAAVADFNRDDRLDLAVASAGSNKVSFLAGTGAGGFAPPLNFAAGSGPVAIVAGDFNGDSNPDVATANSGAGTVAILIGNGRGGFAAPVAYTSGANPSGLVAADLNADGRLDLAVSNAGANSVAIFLGSGNGTMVARGSVPVGAAPSALTVGDFNGDSLLDLGVANDASGTVVTLIGRGTGDFTAGAAMPVGERPLGIVGGDFNTDGHADLAVANAVSNTISILRGDGLGGFEHAVTLSAGLFARSLAVTDLNGDGQPELISANANANDVWIYLNTRSALPSATIGDVVVTENGVASFIVTLSSAADWPVTLTASTIDGSAVAPSDYTPLSTVLTFDPGVTTLVVSVPVASDLLAEGSETFMLRLEGASGATILRASGIATIQPNGGDADLGLTVTNGATELIAGSVSVYQVTVSNAGPSDVAGVTLTLPMPSGLIAAEWSCGASAGSSCAPAGSNAIAETLSLKSGGNAIFTWIARLSSSSSGTINVTGALGLPPGISDPNAVNNDASDLDPVSVSPVPLADDATVSTDEDTAADIRLTATDANGDTLTFTIVNTPQHGSLSGTAPNLTYTPAANFNGTDTFSFRVSDGVHESAPATVTITVRPVNDRPTAAGQSLSAVEDSARGIVVSASDPDGQPLTFSVNAPQHGTLSGTAPNLTYTPVANYNGPDSFTFSASDGTSQSNPATVVIAVAATNDAPSVHVPTADLSVAAGAQSSSISLATTFDDADTMNGDALTLTVSGHTNPALLTVSLSGTVLTLTYAPGITGVTVVTIRATDLAGSFVEDAFNVMVRPAGPSIIVADASATEGTGLRFTLTLSTASSDIVRVDYSTFPLTATPGSDYLAVTGTVSFAPGIVTQTITVSGVADVVDEDDETMLLALAGAVNASIGDGMATGTIVDNDVARLSINSLSIAEGNTGLTTMTFIVSLSVASDRTVSVDYGTANEVGVGGLDYQSTSGSLTFPAGTITRSVSVDVVGDTLDEANELFAVVLSNASNASIQTVRGYGTIVDDDAPPSLTVASAVVTEGDSGAKAIVFTLTLSQVSGRSLQVNYATDDGAATAVTDYASKAGTMVFPVGVTTRTVTVYVTGDLVAEPIETFYLNLSAPVNVLIGSGQATATIVDNDGGA